MECLEFLVSRAQLCGMFTAGYSAKVTDKHQQDVLSSLGDFVEGDLFTVHAWESEIGGEGIDH